jgi:hypothetical protein
MSDKVKTNSELEKYRNNDIVKKLNLTDSEFRKYIFIIKQMIDADPSSDYISELTRINGKLEVRTIIAEKTVRRLRIKNNYLIRSFSDMDLEVSLTKEYFSKVDATKAKLLD